MLLFLLGGGAAYDLITRNSSPDLFGCPRNKRSWHSARCGCRLRVLAQALAVRRGQRSIPKKSKLELARLEQNTADLLERMDSDSQAGS